MRKKNLFLLFFVCFNFLFAQNRINLQDKNTKITILNPNSLKNIKNKTKEDYEEKPNLLKEPEKLTQIKKKENKDSSFDGDINFNKETQEIDKVHINLGKNF